MNASIQLPNHPRNLFRVIVGIFALALLFSLLAMATGCASPKPVVVTDIVIQRGTNVVRIANPKDTTIKRLQWEGLVLEGYQSTVSAAAVEASRAQAESQAVVGLGALRLAETGMRGMAASKGIQIPPNQMEPPAGMKWTLAPVDDPSKPQPEVEAK